jgi:hypothetical protein
LLCALNLDQIQLSVTRRAAASPLKALTLQLLQAHIKHVLQRKNTLDNSGETARLPPIDMKNNSMTTVLLGLLTLSALASVVLCWLYISNTRELRGYQGQAALINNNRAVINSLANDVVEYSKKHPDIEPVLQSVGLKPGKSAPATTTKPATK